MRKKRRNWPPRSEKLRKDQEVQAQEEYRHREIVAHAICSILTLMLRKFYDLDLDSMKHGGSADEE